MIWLLFPFLYRLRGHDFEDHYHLLALPVPRYARIANLVSSKVTFGVVVGLLSLPDWKLGLITGFGFYLAVLKGLPFDALTSRRGIAKLTLRGLYFVPVLAAIYLYTHGFAATTWADALSGLRFCPAVFFLLTSLLMGVVQYGCGRLPVWPHAKLEAKLIDRLWKGQAEVYELAFGAVLAVAAVGVQQ